MALSTLGVAPTVGEKGVALKVGETAASHLQGHNWIILSGGRRQGGIPPWAQVYF